MTNLQMANSPIPISAIVITNEEESLLGSLESLAWADEVAVVDSVSTDATIAIAQRRRARVVLHHFAKYAAQRSFAYTQTRHDWVLLWTRTRASRPTYARPISLLRIPAAA
jgi:Glycosyl transferase family 2